MFIEKLKPDAYSELSFEEKKNFDLLIRHYASSTSRLCYHDSTYGILLSAGCSPQWELYTPHYLIPRTRTSYTAPAYSEEVLDNPKLFLTAMSYEIRKHITGAEVDLGDNLELSIFLPLDIESESLVKLDFLLNEHDALRRGKVWQETVFAYAEVDFSMEVAKSLVDLHHEVMFERQPESAYHDFVVNNKAKLANTRYVEIFISRVKLDPAYYAEYYDSCRFFYDLIELHTDWLDKVGSIFTALRVGMFQETFTYFLIKGGEVEPSSEKE